MVAFLGQSFPVPLFLAAYSLLPLPVPLLLVDGGDVELIDHASVPLLPVLFPSYLDASIHIFEVGLLFSFALDHPEDMFFGVAEVGSIHSFLDS